MIADFEKGDLQDIINGVMLAGQIIKELPADLATCKNIEADIAKLTAWAAKFAKPVELVTILAKNLLAHWSKIVKDVKTIESDWDASSYYQCGDDVADLVIQALGKPTEATQDFATEVDWGYLQANLAPENFLF